MHQTKAHTGPVTPVLGAMPKERARSFHRDLCIKLFTVPFKNQVRKFTTTWTARELNYDIAIGLFIKTMLGENLPIWEQFHNTMSSD